MHTFPTCLCEGGRSLAIFAPIMLGFVLIAGFSASMTAYPTVLAAILPEMVGADLRMLTNIAIVAASATGLIWVIAARVREKHRSRRVMDMDPVTALFNRQSFVSKAARALPQDGVLLLLDIDKFREINDQGGRKVGDLCLMALAQRFRELTRSTDIVGRLDGATFAVYLPGTSLDQAHEIADRLSRGVIVANDEITALATTSVGMVAANGRTAFEQLLRNAGGALERGKLQGRASVVSDAAPLAA